MKKIFLALGLGVLLMLQSCYDEYQTDYKYSATYFARQYPLRTLIATNDSTDMTLEVGVVIAGKRLENLGDESVSFRIAPELVDSMKSKYPTLKVLPESYYTLSNDTEFDIIKREGTSRVVKITIDKDSFVNDPDAAKKVYAIPFEIASIHNVDSILPGKEFTMVMVKFYNQYEGDYFVRGLDRTVATDGATISEYRYGKDDDIIVSEWTNAFHTTGFQSSYIDYVGQKLTTSTDTYRMNIKVVEDGRCIISGNSASKYKDVVGSGIYDKASRDFILEYSYQDEMKMWHEVFDTAYYQYTKIYDEVWFPVK